MNNYNDFISPSNWYSTTAETDIVPLVSEIDISNELQGEFDMILDTFANNFAKEIIQKRLIEMSKDSFDVRNPFNTHVTYRAQMKIVPPRSDITKATVNGEFYMLENNKFTHKQVEEAVKNMYPEYFI
jgi:hypothetical protein